MCVCVCVCVHKCVRAHAHSECALSHIACHSLRNAILTTVVTHYLQVVTIQTETGNKDWKKEAEHASTPLFTITVLIMFVRLRMFLERNARPPNTSADFMHIFCMTSVYVTAKTVQRGRLKENSVHQLLPLLIQTVLVLLVCLLV
jgi:hypothetical protein